MRSESGRGGRGVAWMPRVDYSLFTYSLFHYPREGGLHHLREEGACQGVRVGSGNLVGVVVAQTGALSRCGGTVVVIA